MKHLFFLFTVLFSNPTLAQKLTRTVGIYQIGDTTVEVKSWETLNSIREFKTVKGQDKTFFRNYYLDTKLLMEEGAYVPKNLIGIWKFYDKKGKLEKTINYDTNEKTLYGKTSEPYDEIINRIQKISDSLLIATYGQKLFSTNIIQNTNYSYYRGKDESYRWFEIPNQRPIEFTMRYDFKLSNNIRCSFFEFELDSLGSIKNNYFFDGFSNMQNNNLLTLDIIDSLGIKYGLLKDEKPFSYKFHTDSDTIPKIKLQLRLNIIGKPYETIVNRKEILKLFHTIIIDPWTGELIGRENGENTIIID